MKWLRSVLSHFALTRHLVTAPPAHAELERTRPRHRQTIEKADRVLRAYRELDGALAVYIRRKR